MKNKKRFRVINTPMGKAIIDPATARQVHDADIVPINFRLSVIVEKASRKQIGIVSN